MTQAGGMSLLRLDVNESLLRWAMNRSDKSVDKLSTRQDLKSLNEWLAGTKKPTRLQLEAFAKATYTPFGYLLLPEPPQEQPSLIPHFRTMKDSSSPKRSINLEDTIKIVERRQEWVRDYLMDVGAEPLEFVGSSNVDDDPVDVSDMIRETLGLAPDWTTAYAKWEDVHKHLRRQIENARIFVSQNTMVQNNRYRPLDPQEFRGFVLVDDYAPFVFVNGADIAGAQMFTLAHELAHVWMGKSASFDLRDLAPNPDVELERVCNKIAAEFLAPTEEMLQHWDQFREHPDGPYKAASNYFKVSRIVAARRALDTGCISQEKFDEFYAEYLRRQNEWKKQRSERGGGPPFYVTALPRIGNRFLRTVITAVGERRLLYSDVYSLTGLKSETFDSMKAEIKGKRR